MRICFAFRIENARFDCRGFVRLAQIICNLPVEKAKPVRADDTELGTLGKVQEDGIRHHKLLYAKSSDKKSRGVHNGAGEDTM
ncbi:MAG: hypothetical protein DME65_09335 [Verrucomicrobia bacterium]|nr:MAG: hypothetical protein DME65_09335 [Verrucomicrobiota bacterium]